MSRKYDDTWDRWLPKRRTEETECTHEFTHMKTNVLIGLCAREKKKQYGKRVTLVKV